MAAAKVGWAQLRVGIMAIVAMAILGSLIFILTGTGDIFQRQAVLKTFMDDSAALATGTPVRLNGILIGSIDDVKFTGSKEPGKIVEIALKVRQAYLVQIPVDSVAGISASNLLGDKFINITKGTDGQTVKDGDTLRNAPVQDIPELMARAGDLLGALQGMLKRFEVMLEDVQAGRGNIGKFLRDEELYNRVIGTAAEAQKAVAALNSGQGTLGKLLYDDSLFQELRLPIQKLDALLAELDQGKGTAGKFLKDPAVFDEIQRSVAEMRRLVDDLNAGKGTAGKLLKDEELHKQFIALMTRVDTTMDKINSGQGTLGQLMNNAQLYEAMNGTTRELQALVKDMRANPKKFLSIKLALF